MKVDFSNLHLKIGDEKIERIGKDCKTKYFKFVGHHLDEFLTWDYQLNHVYSKLAGANFAIARVKHFAPLKVRLTLYNSLFRSHLEFGMLAWAGINPTKLKKITTLQKKCVRNVMAKGPISHTDPMFSKLKILKLDDLFKYNCSTFMHKCNNGLLPESFDNFFLPFANPNRNNDYIIEKYKNKFLTQFPTYFLTRIWNSNKRDLKWTESHKLFKKELYGDLISLYPMTINCREKNCKSCYQS